MGKLIGIIPWRVISIMDLLELSGSDALAEVKDWGTAIDATIKAEGQAIYDEGIERKTNQNGSAPPEVEVTPMEPGDKDNLSESDEETPEKSPTDLTKPVSDDDSKMSE
ncbi:hypothetical protein quinque_002282 [Culex quinquefasciatus]